MHSETTLGHTNLRLHLERLDQWAIFFLMIIVIFLGNAVFASQMGIN